MPIPKIDRAVVLNVAKLACLSLSDAEVDQFTGELGRVLGYVAELDALDTKNVPATAHVLVERMPLRQDEVRAGLSHGEALSEAPLVEGGRFAVPAFLE